jgi:hypothetical protein
VRHQIGHARQERGVGGFCIAVVDRAFGFDRFLRPTGRSDDAISRHLRIVLQKRVLAGRRSTLAKKEEDPFKVPRVLADGIEAVFLDDFVRDKRFYEGALTVSEHLCIDALLIDDSRRMFYREFALRTLVTSSRNQNLYRTDMAHSRGRPTIP